MLQRVHADRSRLCPEQDRVGTGSENPVAERVVVFDDKRVGKVAALGDAFLQHRPEADVTKLFFVVSDVDKRKLECLPVESFPALPNIST